MSMDYPGLVDIYNINMRADESREDTGGRYLLSSPPEKLTVLLTRVTL